MYVSGRNVNTRRHMAHAFVRQVGARRPLGIPLLRAVTNVRGKQNEKQSPARAMQPPRVVTATADLMPHRHMRRSPVRKQMARSSHGARVVNGPRKDGARGSREK
jgi:hypothetical protein